MQKLNELMVLQNSPCGIFLADKEMKIVFWNTEIQKMTGISSKDALKQKVTSIKFYNTTNAQKNCSTAGSVLKATRQILLKLRLLKPNLGIKP